MSRHRIILTLFVIPFLLSSQDIDEAIKLFNAFQFDRAREIFAEIANDKENPRIAEAYYYLGRLSINPDSALRYYHIVTKDYLQSRYADVSYLEIAKINIARESYRNAIVTLNELLNKYPDTQVKDEAMFWLGVSNISSENREQGVTILRELTKTFPNSVWSERATNITRSSDASNEYFTIQVGSYRGKSNAQKRSEEIQAKGFKAKVVEAIIKGTLYYRVWVGQFNTIEEAKALSVKLDSLGISGNVVKGY